MSGSCVETHNRLLSRPQKLTLIDNDFLALDLTKSWQISSPSLTGLTTPSGPPPVSLGSLWSSTDSLYLYGGEFSDSPVTQPVPFSLWSYDISSSSWQEHQNPKFSDGSQVQRSAEGAGVSVPGLGLGYYFGGHLDGYTTPGWSQSIARVYLPSMLEFTMPGFAKAGSDGSYRNITVGSAGFPERADGVLVYVPGYSKSGIIVGLAGGTNQTYTQLNILDVYDIETSTWYKQATEGPTPDVRVNPCAVAATSADGTSVQIYMYGGQNLIPYGSQTQYADMWILTIPSFTWIQVDTSKQSVPPARAGHTCNIWNGQMVVVGGYVGQDLSCDSPGIYVFNTSSLEWQSTYKALGGGDALNRQTSQKNDPNALQGSYGYQVPQAVISVVGGNAVGSATVTAPAQTPINGPLATGGPSKYTVTGSDGSLVTQTSVPGSAGGSKGSTGSDGAGSNGPNVGAIVAGVIAGVLFLIALYLAFCTFIYRKQLALYKNHVSMSQRDALTSEIQRFGPGLVGVASRGKSSPSENTGGSYGDRFSSDNRSGGTGGEGSSGHRRNELSSNNPYNKVPGGAGYATAASSTEDLLKGQEPSFLGVMLNPRRSLRVVNKD